MTRSFEGVRVADRGFRYTSFHPTAQCSPTRSRLLTGRNQVDEIETGS